MVNFTITLPEELKAEMDKFPEVNWSEVFRKSAQSYLQTRRNPTPLLDFEIKDVFLQWNWMVASPYVSLTLRATNRMQSEAIIDRIVFAFSFEKSQNGEAQGGFSGAFLEFRQIAPGADTSIQLLAYPTLPILTGLTERLKSTFFLKAYLTVMVQGFPNPLNKEVSTKVPIDEWKNAVDQYQREYYLHWSPQQEPKK